MSTAIEFDPLRLPPEAEALRTEVRAFLAEEAKAGNLGRSAGARFDRDFARRVGRRGWIGMTWPKQYGGHERTFLERYVVTEELQVAKAPIGAFHTADRQSGPVLLRYANEEIKRRVLPRIVAGECSFCIGMSETDSGSDLFAARTRAERTAAGWRIQGTKLWTSYAHEADYMIGLFRTSPATTENRRHGLTQFLVDLRLPGISVRPIRFPNGQHEFNEVVFDDALLPPDHVLGEVDGAWKQATSELAYERSGPERFLETLPVLLALVDLLGPMPDVRGAEGLGRLVAQLFTLRRMSISVAGMLHRGREPMLEASIVKDLGTVWEQRLPDVCRNLAALAGGTPETQARFRLALGQQLPLAPKLTLQGGSTEILRGIIARGLGLR